VISEGTSGTILSYGKRGHYIVGKIQKGRKRPSHKRAVQTLVPFALRTIQPQVL